MKQEKRLGWQEGKRNVAYELKEMPIQLVGVLGAMLAWLARWHAGHYLVRTLLFQCNVIPSYSLTAKQSYTVVMIMKL